MKTRWVTFLSSLLLIAAVVVGLIGLEQRSLLLPDGSFPITEASAVVGGIAALFLLRRIRRDEDPTV